MINIDVLQEIERKILLIKIINDNGHRKLCEKNQRQDVLKTIEEIKELLDKTRMERNLEIKENKL